MNCRKCGCLILETDERCPMCNTKQRNEGRTERNTADNAKGKPMLLIGILVVTAIFAIGFVLFHTLDFQSSDAGNLESVENRFTFINFSENDIFLLNQARNDRTATTFITENGIYFIGEISVLPIGSRLLRTSDYFQTNEEIGILGDWFIDSIHVVEDGVYYTTFGDLYHHCLLSGESTKIADEINNKVIVDHLVFHQRDAYWDSGSLYVFDLISGERRLLIEDIGDFVVDPENDRIIFQVSGEILGLDPTDLFQADLIGEAITLLRHDSWDFTVGNNLMAFEYDFNYLIRNLATGEMSTLAIDQRFQLRNSVFVGEYLVAMCRDRNLWIIDTRSHYYHQLTDRVHSFMVLGNQIIYVLWENRNDVHITNLDGNSRNILSIPGVND